MSRSNRPEDYLCKPGAIKTDRSIPGNWRTWVRFPYVSNSSRGYVTDYWHLYAFTIKWDIKYHSAPGPHPGRRKFFQHNIGYRMMNWAQCGLKGRDEECEFLQNGRLPPDFENVCPRCRDIWVADRKVYKEREKKIDDDPEAWYNLE